MTPQQTEHSLRQNIAAISAEFHAHRDYNRFYDRFGESINGFVGHYDLCVGMAEALTDWEASNGGLMAYENAGVPWIELVEAFVDDMFMRSLRADAILGARTVLRQLQVLP